MSLEVRVRPSGREVDWPDWGLSPPATLPAAELPPEPTIVVRLEAERSALLAGRLISLALALALHILGGWLLFEQWAFAPPPRRPSSPPIMVDLLPSPPAAPKPAPHPRPEIDPPAKAVPRPTPTAIEPAALPFAPALPELALPIPPLPNANISSESPPPTPPPSTKAGKTTFEGLLLARIGQFRRYPPDAQRRRQQGVVHLFFRMNRSGHILAAEVERSSGVPSLDMEALRTLRRAEPLPTIPPDRADVLEVSVPVEFYLRTGSGRKDG